MTSAQLSVCMNKRKFVRAAAAAATQSIDSHLDDHTVKVMGVSCS